MSGQRGRIQRRMPAEPLCKLGGVTRAPSVLVSWWHGCSIERDIIDITTANLTHEPLQPWHEEVGHGLLVLGSASRERADSFGNLTVKKIPRHAWERCEWGPHKYSLRVVSLPETSQKTGWPALFEDKRT